jgi:hypothetical protein
MEWIDVPVTMKVWQCEGPETHFFERDEAGRLVQRTPEALYRKILTETARLRRITYPPPAEGRRLLPAEMERVLLRPARKILPDFKDWLMEQKGIDMPTWFRTRSETERAADVREYGEWMKRTIREMKDRGEL